MPLPRLAVSKVSLPQSGMLLLRDALPPLPSSYSSLGEVRNEDGALEEEPEEEGEKATAADPPVLPRPLCSGDGAE